MSLRWNDAWVETAASRMGKKYICKKNQAQICIPWLTRGTPLFQPSYRSNSGTCLCTWNFEFILNFPVLVFFYCFLSGRWTSSIKKLIKLSLVRNTRKQIISIVVGGSSLFQSKTSSDKQKWRWLRRLRCALTKDTARPRNGRRLIKLIVFYRLKNWAA